MYRPTVRPNSAPERQEPVGGVDSACVKMESMFLRLALLLFTAPALVSAATSVLFDPLSPAVGPFPSDALTVFDPLQRTGLRVNLPVPDCSVQYTSCQEAGLLDQLDGFSLRARLRIRFSGPVNTATLRDGVFFVPLDRPAERVPIDQVIWDAATNTAYAKPDTVLDQQRRYAIVITDAVKDAAGASVTPDPAFTACSTASDGYCGTLAAALRGLAIPRVAGASVFTTMSATAWLEHARDVLDYVPPYVSLLQPQSTFRVSDLAALTLHEQVGVNPARFSDFSLPVADNPILSGLDRLVIGSFQSPNFLEADQTIRNAPTLPGLGVPAGTNQVYFNAFLPSTPKPAGGYPVVIFGHGSNDSRFGGPTAVAPTLARAGLAVIAITAVGHGFGPLSTVTIADKSGNRATFTAGGRGLDINGDGVIGSHEGCIIETPITYGLRDCFRQTVVDLMQLTRVLRLGLDLDGDGQPDLDGSRIYYTGDSLGSMYGPIMAAVEPSIRAVVLNVGGASSLDVVRWSPAYRDIVAETLALRQPPLLNKGTTYDEDYVLPQQPPHTVTVPGALDIQQVSETTEWLGMAGDPISFVQHLHDAPLPGRAARPVLVQMARADQTMPNPATSLMIKSGRLQDFAWIYRHDLARAKAPDLPADPHPFLVLFVSLDGGDVELPGLTGLAISLDAQGQVADFLRSGGTTIADPNGLSALLLGLNGFEKVTALPWDLGF